MFDLAENSPACKQTGVPPDSFGTCYPALWHEDLREVNSTRCIGLNCCSSCYKYQARAVGEYGIHCPPGLGRAVDIRMLRCTCYCTTPVCSSLLACCAYGTRMPETAYRCQGLLCIGRSNQKSLHPTPQVRLLAHASGNADSMGACCSPYALSAPFGTATAPTTAFHGAGISTSASPRAKDQGIQPAGDLCSLFTIVTSTSGCSSGSSAAAFYTAGQELSAAFAAGSCSLTPGTARIPSSTPRPRSTLSSVPRPGIA